MQGRVNLGGLALPGRWEGSGLGMGLWTPGHPVRLRAGTGPFRLVYTAAWQGGSCRPPGVGSTAHASLFVHLPGRSGFAQFLVTENPPIAVSSGF